MPNGGSDCCGTCWFNSANEGRAGYAKELRASDVRCVIRGLQIETPFWTYCANHPHHNPDRIEVPIGPVYVTDDYPHSRRILEASPDSEEIRLALLRLIERMEETPRAGYPSSTNMDDEVIKQLSELREPRAMPALRRIARFDPLAAPPGENRYGRDRLLTVGLAVEALAVIDGDGALDDLETALHAGLPGRMNLAAGTARLLSALFHKRRRKRKDEDDRGPDPLATIRYHAVLGLKHCKSERAKALIETASSDPHPEVAALARGALTSGKADT